MLNSFLFFVVKNKGQTQKASGPKVADRQHVGVEKLFRSLVVRSRAQFLVGGGGDVCGKTAAHRSHLKIATAAMRNSFILFVVKKHKGQTQKASGPKVADRQHVGVEKFKR